MRISDWSSDVCSSDLAFALRHARQEREDHAHRAEIVQLHRAFEVMEAGGRLHDRATDRASGVVDENVDVAKVEQERSEKRRVGKECVSTVRSRLSTFPSKKKCNRMRRQTYK